MCYNHKNGCRGLIFLTQRRREAENAKMTVSISGDDIKTITCYYADPSQPNIGDLRDSEPL